MPLPIHHVFAALRAPEDFTAARVDDATDLRLLAALAGAASVGVGLYAAALHAFDGVAAMAVNGMAGVAAAGIAWTATLPTLYVIDALLGSRLRLNAVALAALVTVSFGGLAMLASIPVLWFFELCLPYGWARLAVALVTFAGVGLSMSDVFLRVMARLEGPRLVHWAWLGLLGVVGAEMFVVFDLFNLGS